MDLTDRERMIILDLITLAWKSGSIRTEEMGDDLKLLKAKMLPQVPEPEKKA